MILGKYSGFLYRNEFFVLLLVLTIWGVVIFFVEYEFYILKNNGGKVMGKVVRFDVIEEKSLKIKYVYQVREKEYTGCRFYREKQSYDSVEMENIVKQIDGNKEFMVYYDLDNPDCSVCFLTEDALRLDRSGVMIIIALWGIFGCGWLQVKVWNRS